MIRNDSELFFLSLSKNVHWNHSPLRYCRKKSSALCHNKHHNLGNKPREDSGLASWRRFRSKLHRFVFLPIFRHDFGVEKIGQDGWFSMFFFLHLFTLLLYIYIYSSLFLAYSHIVKMTPSKMKRGHTKMMALKKTCISRLQNFYGSSFRYVKFWGAVSTGSFI